VNKYSKLHRVGVVGFRGYSGAELLRLLGHHPGVETYLLEHRSETEMRRGPLGVRPLKTVPATAAAAIEEGLAVVFLATPAEVSMELAPLYLKAGVKVVDLSGAYRLKDVDTFARWYSEDHTSPHLLEEAVYGLPEFNRDAIRQARLVANPGCYPTAANLAIRPLIEADVIDRSRGIVCDAKSGVTGAGRKPTLKTSFSEVAGNFSAYSILKHRHVPEVLQTSGLGEREFTFVAQLLPINRGILETIHIRVQRIKQAVELLAIYEERYENEPFVRLYAPGAVPDLFSVNRTNFCDIGFVFDVESQRVVIVAAIDNLVKGAAGQAVQNMNLLLDLPETEGLL
jgi:N-acetyl-gamma-glutamyl-phosphate reductase